MDGSNQQPQKDRISIIIIEDDESQIQVIKDAIDDYNEGSDYIFTCQSVTNYNDSLEILLTEDFDVAIIDLSLDQISAEPSELGGNKLINIIRKKLRIPIIIRTGLPTHFEAKEIDKDNNFLEIFSKDQSVDNILNMVVKWFKSGLTQTLGTNGILEYYLNIFFWKQISLNIQEWEESGQTSKEQEKSLLRYTLNVLQSYLEIDSESGGYDSFHPAEVYIKPPVNEEDLMFGDILKNSDEYYLILTPSCEMAQNKFRNLLICKVVSFTDVELFSNEKTAYLDTPSTKKKSNLEKWFRNSHSNSLSYHFLPEYSDFPGGFLDFQNIRSVNVEDGEYIKIATVTNQFAKDISGRFTMYYARQGQPNLNSEMIFNSFSEGLLSR